MILDSRLEFSNKQSVAATAASTNVVDLSSDRDIGPGRTMWVVLAVTTAISAASASVALETDNAEGFGTKEVLATVTLPTAVGSRLVIGIPYTNKRYLRLNYTIGTGVSGNVSAWLTDQEPASWQAYPDA